jgi:glycolate oxidase
MDLAQKVAQAVGKEYVSKAPEDLITHSFDASQLRALPSVVVRAHDAEQISRLMRFANEEKVAVFPRGAASGLTGGSVPGRGGIVLNMEPMNRILDIDARDLVAMVEPGVLTGELQKRVEAVGLFYPPDPGSSDFSTIGGNIAENAGGMRTIKYGVTRDYVLWLECVMPDGAMITTGSYAMKSVTGYDLTRLIVGCEGTLAVVTKALMRLIPLPKHVKTLVAFFDDETKALKAASEVVAAPLVPRAMEFMDHDSMVCVAKYKPSNLIDPAYEAVLVIECDGNDLPTVAADADAISDVCKREGAVAFHAAKDEAEREDIWQLRKSVSPGLFTIAPGKINEDVAVPRARLSDLLRRIREIGRDFGVNFVNYGHAGDGNLHVNVMFEPKDADLIARAKKAMEQVFHAAVALRGTISAEHGIGLTKRDYLGIELSEKQIDVMRTIKRIFDPNNVLNPGKVFA